MILRTAILSAFFISSTGLAVTEADLLNAENNFSTHLKNVEFIKNHMDAANVDTGSPVPSDDNGTGGTPSNPPWYGERESWTDLVVAMRTLQTVTNNVQTALPSLKFVLFNFPVFTVRQTALCSQMTQINTAWTALEFGEQTSLPIKFQMGPIFYQDARAIVNVIRGAAGLQCL